MNAYRKIPNVFKFDSRYQDIIDYNEPFKTLYDITWIGTEKVDGTNIRVHWDGYKIEIKGRTDNAQFQDNSQAYLEKRFLTEEMEYIFEQLFNEKDVIIYGECYGPKIQTGGGLYADEPKFIVFDIDINGFHLKRKDILDICEKLNLDLVPVVFRGTIQEAKEFISKHPMSTLNSNHEMEGLVLELSIELYDKSGWPIKGKIKYRDMLKAGLIEKN